MLTEPRVRLQGLELSEVVRLHARRHVALTHVPRDCVLMPNGRHYHNADRVISDRICADDQEYALPDPQDPCWPRACTCGYEFTPDDASYYYAERLWRTEDGRVYELADAPVGSVWNAYWMPGVGELWHGPDEQCLVIRTAGGDWWVDGPSQVDITKRGWARIGTAPTLSVEPGVTVGGWRGRLINGYLVQEQS